MEPAADLAVRDVDDGSALVLAAGRVWRPPCMRGCSGLMPSTSPMVAQRHARGQILGRRVNSQKVKLFESNDDAFQILDAPIDVAWPDFYNTRGPEPEMDVWRAEVVNSPPRLGRGARVFY